MSVCVEILGLNYSTRNLFIDYENCIFATNYHTSYRINDELTQEANPNAREIFVRTYHIFLEIDKLNYPFLEPVRIISCLFLAYNQPLKNYRL